MPGPRYTDWHHIRFVGDRDVASRYLPEARKVLGFVQEQTGYNALQTYAREVKLADGTIIRGEVIGGIPRVTINVASVSHPRTTPLVDGFILRPHADVDVPSGVHLDPVLLTSPPQDAEAPMWHALFFNSASFGRDDTPGGARGTYMGTFGPAAQLPRQLGGGACWTSRDGELVSWFRGYAAYWPQHYANPGAHYSFYVSIFGHVVFTVPQIDMRVMAAAARDGHLYVWIASGLWEMPEPSPPASPATCGDVWASQPFSDRFYVFQLYRLPLITTTSPLGVRIYSAAKLDDGEKLLEVPLQRAYGAWSFNRDVTKLVSIQLPEKAVFYRPTKFYPDFGIGGDAYAPSDEEESVYPTTGAQRFQVAITHADDGVTASLSQSAAEAIVAEEDGVVLELVERGSFFDDTAQVNYKCGDWELLASYNVAPGGIRTTERNICLYAHLPTRTFVFYNCEYDFNAPRYIGGRYRVFRPNASGEITEVTGADPNPLEIEPPPSLALDLALSGALTVMGCGKLNTAGTAWDWFRPWDGITTLLCIVFDRTFVTAESGGGMYDSPWLPVWLSPLISFRFVIGARSGTGGVFFGSHDYTGPWTWDWSDGVDDTLPKRFYFNGTGWPVINGQVARVDFDYVAAATYDPHQSPPETLIIADATPMYVQARVTYPGPDEPELLDTLCAPAAFRWATVGGYAAALSGLETALPSGRQLGNSAVLGHTGKPQREQRAGRETA